MPGGPTPGSSAPPLTPTHPPAERPRAVVVTIAPPVPGWGGSLVRTAATVAGLAVDHDVSVVLVGPPGRYSEHEVALAAEHCGALGVELVDARRGARPSLRRAASVPLRGGAGRLLRALQGDPPAALAERVAAADLVWVAKAHPVWHEALPAHPALVVDVDDLDERIPTRPSPRERLRLVALRGARRRLLGRARVGLVCSELDRARLAHPRVEVLANTALGPSPTAERAPLAGRAPVALFVGRLAYGPNAEGAAWLAERVWPTVHAAVPAARLRLVGPGADEALRRRLGAAEPLGVELVGPVEDVGAELGAARVAAVPVHAGSGTRVKVLEAFAWAVPVVSTTLGAEGLEVRPGHHLAIADDPTAFADRLIALLTDPARGEAMATAARAAYNDRWAPDAFTARVRAVAAEARGASVSPTPRRRPAPRGAASAQPGR